MSLTDDLTYIQQLNNLDPAQQPNKLASFNDDLSGLYTSLTNLNDAQINAISNQDQVVNIVDSEADRLADKKSQIDAASENQKRIIYFNENSRKIYAAYLNITITITIVLAIIWVIRVLNYHFNAFIPIWILNTLIILTISIGLIVIYNYYIGIRSRDNYNFDELRLNPPKFSYSTETESPVISYGASNANTLSSCTGSYCCNPPGVGTPGTRWDPSQGVCVFAPGLSAPTIPSGTDGPIRTVNPSGTDGPIRTVNPSGTDGPIRTANPSGTTYPY